MNSSLLTDAERQFIRFDRLKSYKSHVENSVLQAKLAMDKVLKEQKLLERTTVAVQQARPLLSASSIKQCENLANSAISSVFGFPYTIEFDVESSRFILNKGDYKTDLADAEGGGILTVVSTVFQLYLLIKLGKRKFMAFDEAWYAVSDKYFEAFISFVKQACHDLGVDICLISHDERLTEDMVDHVYKIEDGLAIKIK